MNKKLKEYFEGLGLSVKDNGAYGYFKGFEVSANVRMLDQVAPVKIRVNFFTSFDERVKIISEIKQFNFKYFTAELDRYGIKLGFNDPLTVGKLLNRMPEMLYKIFEVIQKYEVKGKGYCPVCGEELNEEAKAYNIDGYAITLDNKCMGNINNLINMENKEFKDSPNNYLKGALGACIGAIVGILAYVILFFIGYVSSLTSFVAILLGAYLYKKFEGKQNAVMIVIVSSISILSMLLAVFGIYVLAAQGLASQYGFSSFGIEAFFDMMTINEFSKEFTSNLTMTFFYTVLGVVFEIVRLSKTVKRQGEIK